MLRTVSAWFGSRSPSATSRAVIRGGHVARREQGGVGDVEDGPAVCLFGRRDELIEVDPGPGALPGVDAFVDQPHAHDVAEVADSSVDAALVGEVRDAALFGEDGLVELD